MSNLEILKNHGLNNSFDGVDCSKDVTETLSGRYLCSALVQSHQVKFSHPFVKATCSLQEQAVKGEKF